MPLPCGLLSCPLYLHPCSGAELIVPHDGEPGPTQRYLELYLKALETVSWRCCRYCRTAGAAGLHCAADSAVCRTAGTCGVA
jgi:hypothetical protein